MSAKPPLVEYRRNSSDMDLSSSDEDLNDNTNSELKNKPSENITAIDGANQHGGAVDGKNRVETVEEERGSQSLKEDRVQEWEKLREQKMRDDKHDNEKKFARSKDYDRDRRDRRKEHSDSKHERPNSGRSRERSRGRSPHHENSHYRHRSRSPGRKKHSPDRHRYSPDRRDHKRSHSPDYRYRKYRRSSRSPETYRSRRLERKVARIDKLGLDVFSEAKQSVLKDGDGTPLASFCNPGAANPAARLTEQIQKRRLLWGAKKETPPVGEPVPDAAGSSKAWEAATFKGDNDGKMTEKFKRLMGIKGDTPAGSTAPEGSALIKKQEEMFSNMEAQYQVARMATHTHRGIGLGFGTFQVPPR